MKIAVVVISAVASALAVALGLVLGLVVFSDARHVQDPVTESDLIYLFDRPAEPVFTLRGINRDVAFDVPVQYLPERYKSVAASIASRTRTARRVIPVPLFNFTDAEIDFADIAKSMPYRSSKYTRAAPVYIKMAIRFQHFIAAGKSNGEVLARGVWLRLNYHPELVLDALRGALVRRSGAQQGVQMPEITQYLPEMWVDDKFFAKAREEMHVVPDGERVVITVIRNETQKVTDESKTWYWLEDPHMNVFHWRWHINYPPGYDDDEYVDRDRRGELFCYFHRQMISRLNAERLANGAPPVKPLHYREPIAEAFFPKMLDVHQGKGYPGRQANSSMLANEEAMNNFDLWHERIREGFSNKFFVKPDGEKIPLVDLQGLDLLANALEPNGLLSPNIDYYGNIHNGLHGSTGGAHDPLHQNYEAISTMSVLTTVRDTVFYRLHQHIDDLFEEYKLAYLQPYTENDLSWSGVSVKSVSLRSNGTAAKNELRTFWQLTDLDLSLGLDYTPAGRVFGRFQHLQHERFSYNIEVNNEGSDTKQAYVRIFLLMLTDKDGNEIDPRFQQHYAIEMDRFEATLKPGLNTVLRESSDTPLTIDQDSIYAKQTTAEGARRANQCRCGWPQTLLVPRGTEQGLKYKLFAMVTDYTQDAPPQSGNEICHDGWLLCGVPGSDYYPDKRPMGFPFDRKYRPEVAKLDDFLTENMAVQDIVIKFDNERVLPPSALLPGGASTSWMP